MGSEMCIRDREDMARGPKGRIDPGNRNAVMSDRDRGGSAKNNAQTLGEVRGHGRRVGRHEHVPREPEGSAVEEIRRRAGTVVPNGCPHAQEVKREVVQPGARA